ncbi:lipase class 3 [Achlya hypogyna]|uniref:Lipase class 3 n=1 Tax=Achlya hypogyna TaxID=1202772 RepID=A0A1V9YKL6_ACHHY|nr:lipase class 3 [Achlya hypogyna]
MRRLLLLAAAASATHLVDNTAEIPLDLSRFCSGGGAFGLYERQTGCALGNCECFPVLFSCDNSLANGLGECTLSGIGELLLVIAFVINLLVPAVYVLSHFYHDGDDANGRAVLLEERSSRRATLDHQPSISAGAEPKEDLESTYFDMTQFRRTIPDRVFGLDKTAKIKLEVMSKGWIQFIFFFMLAIFSGCLVLFAVSANTIETPFPLSPSNATRVNATAFALVADAVNATFPQGTRFVSLHGDVCHLPPQAAGIVPVELGFAATASVDGKLLFDTFHYERLVVRCACSGASCRPVAGTEDALVSIPWFQDAFQVVGHDVMHSVHIHAMITANVTLRRAPVVSLVAHHARLERVLEVVKWTFLVADVVALGYWGYLNRHRGWTRLLPERRLLYLALLCNALGSSPVVHFTQAFLSSTWSYLFAQAWAAALSAAWLLCLLVAIDLQRQRTFRWSFFALKVLLLVVAMGVRGMSFYAMPAAVTSLVDLFLAALAMILFRGVMMSVRNDLRRKAYAASRPEQLTARVLYFVALQVTYVYFFAALFADPVPKVQVYLANARVLTNLPIQVIARAATLVLFVIFLPVNNKKRPQFLATTMVFTRENSLHAAQVSQTVHTPKPSVLTRLFSRLSRRDGPTAAPPVFCLETACGLYNQSCYAYYAVPETKALETDLDLDLAAVARDGLSVVAELFDAETDTHAIVFTDAKRAFVAFRGTFSRQNAVTDLDYNFCKPELFVDRFPDLRLHTGFYRAYMSVRAQLLAVVAAHDQLQWFVTGHSLGGALGTIAAFDLMSSYALADVTVYTYGSPRVGNHAFAHAYNQFVPKTFRVVNDADVIVGGPKQAVFGLYCVSSLRYKHVGTAVLLSDRACGTFLVDPNIVEMAFIAKLRSNGFSHLLSAYRMKLARGVKATLAADETTPLSV